MRVCVYLYSAEVETNDWGDTTLHVTPNNHFIRTDNLSVKKKKKVLAYDIIVYLYTYTNIQSIYIGVESRFNLRA